MATTSTTVNDNNTSVNEPPVTIATTNATVNANNSSGNDTFSTDGTGAVTVNANNSTGNDDINIANASSAAVNLNNSTGNDDVDITGTTVNATVNDNNSGVAGVSGNDCIDITGAIVTAAVNLNNSVGNDDVSIVGTTSVNATVNDNNSGVVGGTDIISINGAAIVATVNLNNSVGNDDVIIGGAGTTSVNATVNLNNSGGTDVVNITGASAAVTVNLTNSTGGDLVELVGAGTGTINATNSLGSNTLVGDNTTDTITGGKGNDILDLMGAGTINAGAGNDLGIYTLSDHYGKGGGADYYYGQGGTDTLEIVLTAAQYTAQTAAGGALYGYHLGANTINPATTYTFNFGGGTAALTVEGWQTLKIVEMMPVIAVPGAQNLTPGQATLINGVSLSETGNVAGETFTVTLKDTTGDLSANTSAPGGGGTIAGSGGTSLTITGTLAQVNADLTTLKDTVATPDTPDTIRLSATDSYGNSAIEQAIAVADCSNGPPAPTVSITGTAQEGQVLTAHSSDTATNVTITYQWQISSNDTTWTNISGATGSTYTLVESNENSFIRVQATATDPSLNSTSSDSTPTSAVIDAAPTLTNASISGTVQEGKVLTATATMSDSDDALTYQWQSGSGSSFTAISGATNATYTVSEADEGKDIRVVITDTADFGGGSTTATATTSTTVTDTAPTLTNASISGTVQEGKVLTATATMSDSDDALTYQWQSGSGSSFTAISGATNATYTVSEADEGKDIRVVITDTADFGGGSTTATATTSTTVTDTAPTLSNASISGTVQEGQTLTAVVSQNEGDDPLTYQWQSAGTAISGATNATYTVSEADEGNAISVVITDTADFGGGTTTATATTSSTVTDTAPTLSNASITGTVQEGQTLTAVVSQNEGDDPLTYQWQSAGTAISGATNATYTVSEADEGNAISVVITDTADFSGGTTTATATTSSTVTDTAPTLSNASITGTVQEGQTLTAVVSQNEGDDPLTYQWQSAGTAISGATNATYTVSEADEGNAISVVITDTADFSGGTTTATATTSSTVTDTAPTLSNASITGTVQEGQTLTAVVSQNEGDDPLTYQWQSAGTAISGATNATYTVSEADEGNAISVVITDTADFSGGTTTATATTSSTVTDTAPTLSNASITGTVQEGQTLTAVVSQNEGDDPLTYQWQSAGTAISGATNATYTVSEADEGNAISVVITDTADFSGGTTTATATTSSTVTDTAPTLSNASITGTVQEGQTLTAVVSQNEGDDPLTYQWQSAGTAISGATNATYTVSEADEGNAISVVITDTADFSGGTTTATATTSSTVTDTAPTLSNASITGTVQEGQTLTAVVSQNEGDDPLTYQWQSAGTAISGATNATYTVSEADEGNAISVVITDTADFSGGTTTATATTSSTVTDTAPTLSNASITGTVQEGQTLTAVVSQNEGDDPLTYQWQSAGTAISGATNATYTVSEADEGNAISVVITDTADFSGGTTTATATTSSTVTDTAPTLSNASITGTVQEGQTLTAVVSQNEGDDPLTYQWQSAGTAISGATNATYTVSEADEGNAISVVITDTADFSGGTTTATATTSSTVTDTAPTLSNASITGTVQEGQTLTAVVSQNEGDDPLTYQWQSAGTAISGATNATYTVSEADEGNAISVVITDTADFSGGTTTATATTSSTVTDTAPTLSNASITGTVQEGQTLTAVVSQNEGDDPLTYQWQSAGTAISGATNATYTVSEADEGNAISVVITDTADFSGGTTTATATTSSTVTDTAPTLSNASITGTVQEGQTLTAVVSQNEGDDPLTYQWQSAGTAISGATNATYTVSEADEGNAISVVITDTADFSGGTTTATATTSSTVTDTAPTLSNASITGTVQEGQTLTAVVSQNEGDDPLTYQWQSAGTAISGATNATYTVSEADEGNAISVVITDTADFSGGTTTATATTSSTVTDTAPTLSNASITGTVQEGQTLTAVVSQNEGDDPLTYQWQSAGTAISGATNATYTVSEADEGNAISVVITDTADFSGGTTTATATTSSTVTDTAPTLSNASITGTVQEGQTLTAVVSQNEGDDPLTYQWQSAGTAISGATNATYTVSEADEGNAISVVITDTADFSGGTTTATATTSSTVTDTAPTLSNASITGTVQEGQTLTAVVSQNEGDDPLTYQWQSAGTAISGATNATYTVSEADEGNAISVVITDTADFSGGTTTATATTSSTVTDTAPTLSNASITGTVQEGQTLTAVVSQNEGDDPLTYQWQSAGTAISGATNATYTVSEADEGNAISVVITDTADFSGGTTTATATTSSTVTDTAPTLSNASITGTVQEGQTLTAVVSQNEGDDPLTYQWQSAGTAISGATNATYTVSEADEGNAISVVITDTADFSGGTTTATATTSSTVTDTAPTLSNASITGTVQEGQTLTAVVSQNEGDDPLTYQWQSAGTAISGATNATYTVSEADEGNAISVVITDTADFSGGTTTATATTSSTVTDTAPTLSNASITGTVQEGQTLTAVVSQNEGDDPLTYQWQSAGTAISGATNATYTVSEADEGNAISVVITDTADFSGGTTTATATTSSTVTDTAPTLSNASITGTVQEGQTLTAVVSQNEGDDPLTYQWQSAGTAISGATNATYTVSEADEGNAISVVITDTADFGGGTTTATATTSSTVTDTAPTLSNASITGTVQEGQTLTAVVSQNEGDDPLTYQWQSAGTAISGATNATYTVSEADEGNAISVVITDTADFSGGTTTATATTSSTVTDTAPTLSNASITGTVQEGQTLTAVVSQNEGDDPLTYQWQSAGTAISGATNATYTVSEADEGNAISVVITDTADFSGGTTTATATTSSTVTDTAPTLSNASITGTVQEGQTLTAVVSQNEGDDPLTYQWQSAGTAISGATNATYTVSEADEGNAISVVITDTADFSGGTTTATATTSSTVTDTAPTLSNASITGTVQEGQTLTAVVSQNEGDDPLTYQWQSAGTAISGATNATYTVSEADEGNAISVVITDTADFSGGTTTATATTSSTVTDTAPTLSNASITGTVQEGQTLTAVVSQNEGDDPLTYQWQSAGTAISGATNATYTVSEADEGNAISVVITDTADFSGGTTTATATTSSTVTDTAPTLSNASITGTVQEGQTLTAVVSQNEGDDPLTYQWQSAGTAISGATNATYTVSEADEGNAISVVITDTADFSGGTTTATATTSSTVTDTAPTLSNASITGTVQEGQTLTAVVSQNEGDDPLTYQWQSAGTAISGATNATYTVSEADEGNAISVVITDTADFSGGTTTATATTSSTVTDTAPTLSNASITGTVQEGQTLTAVVSQNEGDDPLTYQWQSAGTAISGATNATYTVSEADEGNAISVVITDTADFSGGTTTATATTSSTVTDTAPTLSNASITGTVQEGQTLTAVVSQNEGDDPLTYQWQSAGTAISGATNATYTVSEADEGNAISVVITDTADFSGGTTTATATTSSTVTDTAPTLSNASITGTVQEGQTLTAVVSQNEGDDPLTYQWQSAGTAISGATNATYTVSEADEGNAISVVITDTADFSGGTTTATATTSSTVTDTAPTLSNASITGTVQEGQTLTAVVSQNEGDDPLTYQWQSAGTAISGATNATYTVSEADEGNAISVVITDTADFSGGTTTATATTSSTVTDTAPTLSNASITGTVQEGQTLTAVVSQNEGDDPLTYQWQSAGTAISGATNATYTVSEADEGNAISVVITDTADFSGGTTTATATTSSTVTDTAPTLSNASITGTVQEGQTLTAVVSQNEGDDPLTYQWQSAGTAISGATNATYTVSEADEGNAISVVITDTADFSGGTTTATATTSSTVTDTAPTLSNASITGTVQEGQTLTAVVSQNEGDDPLTYQWQSAGTAISGATNATYTVSEADEGNAISVVITDTADFSGGTTTATATTSSTVTDTAPTLSNASITGTVQEGQTLTAVVSQNEGDDPLTYQWQSAGTAISGATNATYTVSEADEGNAISVVITDTADFSGGTTTATATTSSTVTDTAPTLSNASITGTVQEGQTLTAVVSQNEGDDPLTYQWQSAGTAISGATNATYTVSEADEGNAISVVITDTADFSGGTTTATATTSSTVTDTAPTLSNASITGTVQEGQTLTAVVSQNEGDDPLTYQWQSAGTAISGATNATYTVSEADEGNAISVVITDTADFSGGTTTATATTSSTVTDTAPTLSNASITGTVQEGQTLTAVVSQNEGDDPLTYQWQSAGTAISGATNATYTVSEADEGNAISVVITDTADFSGGTTTATATTSSTVTDTAPTLSNASITGTVQEGQTLTAVVSQNEGDDPLTYQWQSAGTAISGATNATYTVSEADEGNAISVVITDTADFSGGTTTATATTSSTVTDTALAFTTAASISGTAQQGQVLTAVSGTLNDSDAAITGYQWTSNGSAISGATSATYLVQESDEGKTIRVVETATDSDGGPTTTSTSTATAAVSDITLAFTTAASITGTAQQGQVLTAVSGTLNDSDASVTGYQWTSNGSAISGATSATYTVSEADEGKTIQVVETATDVADGGPTTTSTSTATAAVSDITLAFTTAASITGTAQQGQVLTAVSGTLNDSDAAVTGYQWTSNGSAISGATSATYTVSEADEGKTIRVVETASDTDNGGFTTTSTSTATAAVSDITLAFTTAASITGTAQQGQVLTAVSGTLNDSDAAITGYQWTSNGSAISGATSATYTVSEADEGKTIRVVETATDSDGGPTTTSTSTATAAVTDITLAFTTAASITGTAQQGQVLTAVSGTLNDSDAAVTGYQWTSNGSAISGATSATYTVSEADEGKTIRVVETASDTDNGGFTTTSTSTATAAVSDITLAFTTAASITGTAQQGQVLTAVSGTLNDSDAAVTGYQWTSNGSAISGATSATYTVSEADEGKTIRVVETATDSDGGPTTTSTSTATAAVTDITLAFTTAASISGTAQQGQVLTAVNGTLNDSDASITGYQWTSNGTAISGATSSTYTVSEADEGKTIQVVETATDVVDGGPTTTSTSAATAAVTDQPITVTISGNSSSSGQNGTATFTVTFSEGVTGVALSDFVLFGTGAGGAGGATLTTFTGSGTTYTVTASYTSKTPDKGGVQGDTLGLNFTNPGGNTVHDAETGESTNFAVNTNFTTAQISSLNPAGIAGSPINLALTDPSGGQGGPISITVSGVPSDWSLNAGTNNGDGSWTVQNSDPSALTATTPATFAGAMLLNVTESWTNADGTTGSASIADNVEAYAPGAPIFALSGADTLTGAGANDEFVFAQPIGNDTIYNFNPASDQIDLIGFNNVTSFGAIQANLTDDANGNAVITLAAGETITLKGVDAASLNANDFVLGETPVTTNASSMVISDGAVLPLSGTVDNTGTIALNSTGDETDLELIQNGITLQGGGQLTLSDNSENVITGTAPDVTLTNVDNTISGAGQIGEGQMTLVNEGTIDATGTNALVLDTGNNFVDNSGTLEATGSGGLIVNSAVDNSGSLWANGGNVTFDGAVAGSGTATISGAGTLEFAGASAEAVSFAAGSTGTLKLDNAASFTGTVSGLTTTTYVDFADLPWTQGQMTETFTPNSGSPTSGGKLTVSDGTQSDTINLAGDYTQSTWTLSQDSKGDTLVVDPPLGIDPIGGTQPKAADDVLDMADISSGANQTIGYSASANGAGGTLNVSDGTPSPNIALFGQYAAAGFQVGSDQNNGALVTHNPSVASQNDAPLITNPNQKT